MSTAVTGSERDKPREFWAITVDHPNGYLAVELFEKDDDAEAAFDMAIKLYPDLRTTMGKRAVRERMPVGPDGKPLVAPPGPGNAESLVQARNLLLRVRRHLRGCEAAEGAAKQEADELDQLVTRWLEVGE